MVPKCCVLAVLAIALNVFSTSWGLENGSGTDGWQPPEPSLATPDGPWAPPPCILCGRDARTAIRECYDDFCLGAYEPHLDGFDVCVAVAVVDHAACVLEHCGPGEGLGLDDGTSDPDVTEGSSAGAIGATPFSSNQQDCEGQYCRARDRCLGIDWATREELENCLLEAALEYSACMGPGPNMPVPQCPPW